MNTKASTLLTTLTLALLSSASCFHRIDPARLKCVDDSTCPSSHVCVREQAQQPGTCVLRLRLDGAVPDVSLLDAANGVTATLGGNGGTASGGSHASGGHTGSTASAGATSSLAGSGGAHGLLMAGSDCRSGEQCADGFCVDGVCCTSKCDGRCESCKEAGALGLCKVVQGQPVAPRAACGGTGACQGQCDGSNGKACAFPDDKVICTAATCTDGKIMTASVCNGAGSCTASISSTCSTKLCAADSPGRCSGSCTASSCGDDATCDSSGACVPKLANGKTCSSHAQCTSGSWCVDGVCCDSKCDGQCESCKEAGAIGTCKAISGDPVGARSGCGGSGACKGTCDAANRKACTFPGSGTTCMPASCTSGGVAPAATCDGAGACIRSSWTACPYGLCTSDGRCTGDCTPGTKKCDGLVPSTCSPTGQWVAGIPCENLCSGGACSGTCVPNSKACNDQVPMLCDATATWQNGSPCTNQACVNGVCVGVCKPGSKQCSNNGVQTCGSDGTWGSAAACTNQACVAGACVGVCAPGNKQCADNGVQTCTTNGTWGSAVACNNQACVEGACVGGCVPGTKQCADNGVQVCGGKGTWVTANSCVNKACVGGACTGVCTPGARQCSDNGVQTCGSNGTWGNPVLCVNQSCVNGVCVGNCTPGSKQCAGNNVQTCTTNGTWGSGSSCGTQVCENGACVTNTCSGSEGEWDGCRGTGCYVCAEKLVGYPRYLQNHPGCVKNDTCNGLFYLCNKACPAPSDADKELAACGGTDGQWSGCRGGGCLVCAEQVAGFPNYFNNHPGCIKNDTCEGQFSRCNYACPAPSEIDR